MLIQKVCHNHKFCNGCAKERHYASTRKSKKGYSEFEKPVRKDRKISKENIIYFAGLFDGEGCVRIGKYKNQEGKLRYRAFLQIGMTTKEVLLWLRNNVSGNFYYCKPNNSRSKPSYEWNVRMKEGEGIVKQALPYFIVKKEQAKIYLKFCKTQYKKGWRLGNIGMPKNILNEREELFKIMSKLNKKGVD